MNSVYSMLIKVMMLSSMYFYTSTVATVTTDGFQRDATCYNYDSLLEVVTFLDTDSRITGSIQAAFKCSQQETCAGYLLTPSHSNVTSGFTLLDTGGLTLIGTRTLACGQEASSYLYTKNTEIVTTETPTTEAASGYCELYYNFNGDQYCMHLMSTTERLNQAMAKDYCDGEGGYLLAIDDADDLDGLSQDKVPEQTDLWVNAQQYGNTFLYRTAAYTSDIPWWFYVSDPADYAVGSECASTSWVSGWGWGVAPSNCLGLQLVSCMILDEFDQVVGG